MPSLKNLFRFPEHMKMMSSPITDSNDPAGMTWFTNRRCKQDMTRRTGLANRA